MVNPDQIEEMLRVRLQTARAPSPDLVWQRLQPAIREAAPRAPTIGRAWQVGMGVLVAILATMSIALASSPDVRQQLVGLVGMASAGNRVSALQPVPFAVFQPTDLPAGMRLVAQAYNPSYAPSPASNGQSSWPTIGLTTVNHLPIIEGASALRVGSPQADQQVEVAAQRRAQELLGTAKEATLVLVYANPAGRLVAVVERSAAGKGLPAGDPVTIDYTKGTVSVSGSEIIVSWVDRGTFLQVHATMDRAEAVAFASRLIPSDLASFADAQAAAAALRAISTPVPLAERVAAVETPTVDPVIVANKCGRWDPALSRTTPAASFDQINCVAQAVVGIDQPGSYGLSRESWHEAAARLGLDPSMGPPNNPMVWLAELHDRTERDGWVVVLDTQSGQPYLIIRLKPGQAQPSVRSSQP